jgi:hypothetical protein
MACVFVYTYKYMCTHTESEGGKEGRERKGRFFICEQIYGKIEMD